MQVKILDAVDVHIVSTSRKSVGVITAIEARFDTTNIPLSLNIQIQYVAHC